jgi:hypothetical protein
VGPVGSHNQPWTWGVLTTLRIPSDPFRTGPAASKLAGYCDRCYVCSDLRQAAAGGFRWCGAWYRHVHHQNPHGQGHMKWCHEERLPACGIWEASQSWSALVAGRVGVHCDCLAGSDAQAPVSVQPGAGWHAAAVPPRSYSRVSLCPGHCTAEQPHDPRGWSRGQGSDTTWHRHPAPFDHTMGPHSRLRRIVAVVQAHDQELARATAATQCSHIMLRGLAW